MAIPFSTEPRPAEGISGKVIGMAAGAVLLILLIVAVATLRHTAPDPGALRSADSYAPNFALGNITLTEATNGAGGKVTYIDGTAKNNGNRTVTAADLQVTFVSEDGTPPQRQTVPLTLVRTREPYVDLEPVAAEPLKPGESHDFPLIFETVPAAWDTKAPDLRLVHADTR